MYYSLWSSVEANITMSILFTDMDNTLIYSRRKDIGKQVIAIEQLDGQEFSYMTRFTYEFLLSADWLDVIPVTTRTDRQFKRIEYPDGFGFQYALVCNGGKLLINGVEDEDWSAETHAIVEDSLDSLLNATEQLIQLCKQEAVHMPEEYMSYVKCSNPCEIYNMLSERVDTSKVNIQRVGSKIYLFSNGVSKGNAVERFMNGREGETILAAGDGLLDVSMLNKADYAFSSLDNYELVTSSNNIKIEKGIFSDEICHHINKMRAEGIL